jgi:hypothetical protein
LRQNRPPCRIAKGREGAAQPRSIVHHMGKY